MEDSELEKFEPYVQQKFRERNSDIAYEEFLEAVNEKNHKKIENTLVGRALNILVEPNIKAFRVRLKKMRISYFAAVK